MDRTKVYIRSSAEVLGEGEAVLEGHLVVEDTGVDHGHHGHCLLLWHQEPNMSEQFQQCRKIGTKV